jgi:hypothetical protein
MSWWSKEWPGDLARKCKVPGTFFTKTKPDKAQPLDLATRVTPLHCHSCLAHQYLKFAHFMAAARDRKSRRLILRSDHVCIMNHTNYRTQDRPNSIVYPSSLPTILPSGTSSALKDLHTTLSCPQNVAGFPSHSASCRSEVGGYESSNTRLPVFISHLSLAYNQAPLPEN